MADQGGINAAIPLEARPPQLNPLGTLGQFSEIQNRLNQNRLFQQTFAARQRAGQIIAAAPDLETGLTSLYSDPLTAPFAGEVVNSIRQGQETLTRIQGEQQTQAQSGLAGFLKALPGVMADPSQWGATVQSQLSTLSPTARSRVAPAIESLRTALVDGLPSDPAAARTLFNQRLAGLMIGGGVSPEAIQAIAGKPVIAEMGGYKQPGVQAPAQLGGGFSPAGAQLQMTLAPQVVTGPYGQGGGTAPLVMGGGASPSVSRPGNALGTTGAPSGSPTRAGIQGPGLLESEFLTTSGKQGADYKNALDERTAVGGTIMSTLGEAREALGNFRSGGGASVYARVAQLAQAFGASDKLVDAISNGNLAASQEFQKLMVNTTMGQIREQLQGVGASRLSQQEFKAFNENNPNIDTDPRAIEKIFNFWTRIYNRDHMEQTELLRHLGAGGSMLEWPSKWQDIQQQRGIITPNPKGASPAPKAKSAGEMSDDELRKALGIK